MHFCTKFELCSYIRSTDMKGCQKFDMITMCTWHWFLKPKSIGLDRVLCQVQVIPIKGFAFIVLTFIPTHPHTYTYIRGKIAISRRRTTSAAWIINARSSADADKPAWRVYRSVKVTKHSFRFCNSNFVFKTRRFNDIRLQKMSWPWNRVRGHSRSLKMEPFDILCMVSY